MSKDSPIKILELFPDRGGLNDFADIVFKNVMAQRDQILAAFIAEKGLHPSECVQVVSFDNARIIWRVMAKEDLFK